MQDAPNAEYLLRSTPADHGDSRAYSGRQRSTPGSWPTPGTCRARGYCTVTTYLRAEVLRAFRNVAALVDNEDATATSSILSGGISRWNGLPSLNPT